MRFIRACNTARGLTNRQVSRVSCARRRQGKITCDVIYLVRMLTQNTQLLEIVILQDVYVYVGFITRNENDGLQLQGMVKATGSPGGQRDQLIKRNDIVILGLL